MSKQTELAQVADTITVDSGNVAMTGDLTVDTNTLHVDSTNNRVGIGTSLPSEKLEVSGTGHTRIQVTAGTSSDAAIYLGDSGDSDAGAVIYDNAPNALKFRANGSEAMRLDASGNLLVGKTSANYATVGAQILNTGIGEFTASSVQPLTLRRNTSDGDIVKFYKDGSAVGSIGSVSGTDLFIAGNRGTNSAGIKFTDQELFPVTKTGATQDNAIDVGHSGARFDDIYATNGTIQTSDRNEKQDIAELSDAEQRVSVAAKGLMRKFRWRDAVAEKGEEARTHFGIIAQDLQAAFVAEGLDAGDYAMFISTTWWEHDVEVPAVEAVAEVLDEDGNVVTEAVEAVDAYTRTDTYDTQEEAPEGATERTRLGVRYSELLAFMMGAL